jgi:hypothetical protein
VLVRPNDAEGFCNGLARLIEDERLREKLGERGRRFVEEHYSKERLLADIEKLYRGLANEKQFRISSFVFRVENENVLPTRQAKLETQNSKLGTRNPKPFLRKED